MRRLFEGGTYSSNYCNWQLKSLLHLGQIVITFRTLLHLGQSVISFRTFLHYCMIRSFDQRPSNSHGLTVRRKVWAFNSRSHDLAFQSHVESENHGIARQFWQKLRNFKKLVFVRPITVWHEILGGVCFCRLAIFCVLEELILAIGTYRLVFPAGN